MSSSEDDYMSDAFLTGCVKEDIRPGLIQNRSAKRIHEIEKNKQLKDEENKSNNPSSVVIESKQRETALSEPISVDNKGFAMLQKLGFKPGSGLGKSSAGRTEPVPIELKNNRHGLGRAEAMREKRSKRVENHSKLMNVDTYRTHLAEKTAERRTRMDLSKSQRICKHLDAEWGIEEPEELWYWPERDVNESDNHHETDDYEDDQHSNNETEEEEVENEDEEDVHEEEQNYTEKEKLEMLTHYLRNTHFYCIWCAVGYEDLRDLEKECPGPTYEDH